MTLLQKQWTFSRRVAQLIQKANELGFEIAFGEAYRTPEQAALNAQTGAGIKNSLHTQKLAVDLALFRDGKYLTDTPSYEPLGVFWESLSTPEAECCWGGRFKRADGNHFSVGHNGVK